MEERECLIMCNQHDNIIEAPVFRFYIDCMPQWFWNKVMTNDATLHCCGYNKYSIQEAYCIINTPKGVKVVHGGDYVALDKNGDLQSYKPEEFVGIGNLRRINYGF